MEVIKNEIRKMWILVMKRLFGVVKKLWVNGAFHIFIGSFLTKFIAFFGSIFLVRVLSKNSYGLLGYVENIYGYIYLFAGLGLGNALLRYVILGKNYDEKYSYYKYTIEKGTVYNVLIVIGAIIVFLIYPHPSEFKAAKWILPLLIVSLPFEFLMDGNQLTYRAMLNNKRYAITAFIITTSIIISRYIGAVVGDIAGVVIAKLLVTSIIGIALCFITINIYFEKSNNSNLSKTEKKIVHQYSIQYMITNGIWAVFMLNDIFLIGRLIGDPTVLADYKIAYVLPGNISVITTAIGIFIGPYFVKNENNHKWVWTNYKKTMVAVIGLIFPIVTVIFIFAKPLIVFLYGAQYENVVFVMRLLLIAAFANSSLRYVTAHILASMGQIRYNMIISIVGVVSQLIINLIMIPYLGIVGAAITSIIVYFIMATALMTVFIKMYRLGKDEN